MDKARYAAYEAVKRICGGAYSNLISNELTGLDRAFSESIALGTLERLITLEHTVDGFLQKRPKNDIYALILTGATQILFMDRVPDSAACDETVNIAKSIFGVRVAGFVNAVLRSICREKEQILSDLGSAEGHIRYSVSKDLFELIESQYGKEADNIFEAFFEKQPAFLRVNTLKSNAESVARSVGGKVIEGSTVEVGSAGEAISQIGTGEFYIQGMASQMAVKLLGARPDELIIDMCACPGGKSLGAAIDMKNRGKVISLDLHKKKLPLIEDSARRLGIDIIETFAHDSRSVYIPYVGCADRVICDVPCSGTGVMGAKPEIKQKSPSDFSGLYPTQRAIIRSAARMLKVGGCMVYSTCSINKLENESVVSDFLSENPSYRLEHEETCLPHGYAREGFYMAKIILEK